MSLLALALAAQVATAQTPARVVVIVPLGKVPAADVSAVAEMIRSHVEAEVRVDPARALPQEAYFAPRKRWRAEKLIDALEASPPEGAWKVIALTAKEISTTKEDVEDWGIGGLGTLGGRTCVVSTFLISKHSRTQEKRLARIADLALHEHGHTLGLDHCETTGCVMADAKGKLISSIDASDGEWCEVCQGKIAQGVLRVVSPEAPPPSLNPKARPR